MNEEVLDENFKFEKIKANFTQIGLEIIISLAGITSILNLVYNWYLAINTSLNILSFFLPLGLILVFLWRIKTHQFNRNNGRIQLKSSFLIYLNYIILFCGYILVFCGIIGAPFILGMQTPGQEDNSPFLILLLFLGVGSSYILYPNIIIKYLK